MSMLAGKEKLPGNSVSPIFDEYGTSRCSGRIENSDCVPLDKKKKRSVI